MNNLFVPYDIALALKEIGFDSVDCLGGYRTCGDKSLPYAKEGDLIVEKDAHLYASVIKAPLYNQVIDWLIEKHGISMNITPSYNAEYWNISWYNTKEESFELRNKAHDETFATDPYYWHLKTRKEALNAGILKIIELIKQKS